METFFSFMTENWKELGVFIPSFLAIGAGLFNLWKWLDNRKQALKNERYVEYNRLNKVLSGSCNKDEYIALSEQIASAWMLLEYKEYHHITLKIWDNPNLDKMANPQWSEFVRPQVREVVSEIKKLGL